MFYQKIQSAFFALFIIPFILPLTFSGALGLSYWQSVVVYVLYGIPVVFLYGTLTSMISDYISQKTPLRSKRVTSFFMHLVCGWLFVVPYGLFFDPSIFESGLLNFASSLGILSAAIFFIVDQLLGHYFKTL
ncbi:putative membrane protein [Exiguobacterium sp. S17]|nr:putative membrane protein [Exiguobacterium sp. S17]